MSDVLIYLHGKHVATAHTQRNGAVMLQYLDDYLNLPDPTPLSLALPLDDRPADISVWLDGLLPDNYEVRLRWVREHKAPSSHPIDILQTKVGLDCAGAVQFCIPANLDHMDDRDKGYKQVSDAVVSEWLQQLIKDRTLWSRKDTGGAFSLAGAQAKIALHYEDQKWCIPYGGHATTHILKPGVPNLRNSDIVEHLCMVAARYLGLPAAETSIMHIGNSRALVVKRYDRYRNISHQWERRHQEDVCQALDIPPYLKYEKDGGPNIKSIAALIRKHTPVWGNDVARFADALLFNWLIAGSDAHAKNYSIMLHSNDVSLSPLYDVSSYLPYIPEGEESAAVHLAMSVGGGRSLDVMDRRESWVMAAKDLRMPSKQLLERAAELADNLHHAFIEATSHLDGSLVTCREVEALIKLVELRGKHCLNALRSGNTAPFALNRKPRQPASQPTSEELLTLTALR